MQHRKESAVLFTVVASAAGHSAWRMQGKYCQKVENRLVPPAALMCIGPERVTR